MHCKAALELITQHPKAGRIVEKGLRRFAHPRFPYLIFYRVDAAADMVSVITVRHAARQDRL